MLLIPAESRRERLLKRRSVVETSWILFPRVMASRLHQLRSKIAQASEFIAKQGCACHKELLEKNKQQIVQPSTIEACPDLSKKLLYARLASIPGHLNNLRKELDGVKLKHIWRNKP